MAGAGRRRRFPNRPAWIRRRTLSKQRGAKLRSSSSESDGDAASKLVLKVGGGADAPSKVALKVGGGADAASKLAPKVGGGGDDYGTRSPKLGSGGDGGSCGPNTGTSGCDRSPKHIVEAGGNDDDVSYSPMLGCCCCNEIRKHLVAEEGGCEGTCPLNFGSCDCDGSPSTPDVVACVWTPMDSCTLLTQKLKTVPWRRAAVQCSAEVKGPLAVDLLQPARWPWRLAQPKLPRLPVAK